MSRSIGIGAEHADIHAGSENVAERERGMIVVGVRRRRVGGDIVGQVFAEFDQRIRSNVAECEKIERTRDEQIHVGIVRSIAQRHFAPERDAPYALVAIGGEDFLRDGLAGSVAESGHADRERSRPIRAGKIESREIGKVAAATGEVERRRAGASEFQRDDVAVRIVKSAWVRGVHDVRRRELQECEIYGTRPGDEALGGTGIEVEHVHETAREESVARLVHEHINPGIDINS